jgi:hypothetical protein
MAFQYYKNTLPKYWNYLALARPYATPLRHPLTVITAVVNVIKEIAVVEQAALSE